MKYLFFDVECSNCFNGIGKVCEYGYILTDEKFKIISKDDIPMSPGEGRDYRFFLKGRKNEPDLELAYDYDFYYSQPEFPHFYSRIKKMMEDEETICFAYSMDNDIRHIHNTCLRYKLEPLNYICFDVQRIAGVYLDVKNQVKLEDACRSIIGPDSINGLTEHLSRDDAIMEMKILETICKLTSQDSKTLLEASSYAKTNSIEHVKRFKEKEEVRKQRAEAYQYYREHVASEEELSEESNVGRRYNVGNSLKTNLSKLKTVMDEIINRGGIFSNYLPKTDYLIVNDEDDREYLNEKIRDIYQGPIYIYSEFIKK